MNALNAIARVEFPPEENRGAPQNLVVLPQPPVLRFGPLDLGEFFTGDPGAGAVVALGLGLGQRAPHRLSGDALLAGGCGDRDGLGDTPTGAHSPDAHI